jgi:pimeloyl-ACP methyl ester carboxylesterase
VAADAVRRAGVVEALSARYHEVRVPVTILAGLADQFVDPQGQSFRLHRELPHSVLVEVPGAGHLVAETRPEVVADAVRSVALQTATRP